MQQKESRRGLWDWSLRQEGRMADGLLTAFGPLQWSGWLPRKVTTWSHLGKRREDALADDGDEEEKGLGTHIAGRY